MSGGPIVVTGAAGHVAGLLLPQLADHDLRLVDGRRGSAGQDLVVGDLSEPGFARDVTAGARAVVHLAGNPNSTAAWDDLAGPNVDAVVNLLVAAANNGVSRVVLASSVHAIGGYDQARRWPISPSWPPWPCCTYGATKVFDEALSRAYVRDDSSLSVVCLRLGAVTPEPIDARFRGSWLSPVDLHHLVVSALTADVDFGVYFGVSNNSFRQFDLDNAREELGYAPASDAADHLTDSEPGAPFACRWTTATDRSCPGW